LPLALMAWRRATNPDSMPSCSPLAALTSPASERK